MKRVFAAFALILVSGAAYAQRTAGCACGSPATVPTPWTIRHSDPNAQAAAQASFGLWNTYVDMFRATSSPAAYDVNTNLGNNVNEIAFVDFSTVPGLDPDTIVGYTPMDPDGAFGSPSFNACPMPAGTACGTITEADVWLNNKMPWNDSPPNINEPGFVGYYAGTAVHELGHSLGLHHNFGNVSTMNYYADYACQYITQMDVLVMRNHAPSRVRNVSDLAAYPFTYDPALQTGANDGDNALTVANVSPASVAPGGTITINNWTLENLGTSSTPALILFYLSTDQNITNNDIYIGGLSYSTMASNQYGFDTSGHQFTVPSGTPAGTYYVGAIAASGTSRSNATQDSITYNNTWFIPTPISVGTNGGGTPTVCTPSATTVCLVGNRFQVTMTFNGQTMKANQFTPNTGLFYVSDSTNIEILLKMLDACSFTPYFWLFSGGTTDQSISITAIDTKTGRVKTYGSSGGPFKTITATDAFPCN